MYFLKRIILLSLVIVSSFVHAQSSESLRKNAPLIEIKGISLGMSAGEILSAQDGVYQYKRNVLLGNKGFTVAGINAEEFNLYIGLSLDTGLNQYVLHKFQSSDFYLIRDAFEKKYPSMKCSDSTVQNRMGAKFPQTECILFGKRGVLKLAKYSISLDKGLWELQTYENLEKANKINEKKKSDL